MEIKLQDILKIFEDNDDFLILTHKSPDGDTLGSGFALWNFLHDMGKHANVENSDEFPDRYDFLYKGYKAENIDYKYVIAVDIADPKLIGSGLSKYQEENAVDLCIDHHFSNKQFAQNNYVEGDASACALIMYKLFRLSGREISPQTALCLYTGLATDTGCFKYENTTPEAHIACAELMKQGVPFARINRRMFDIKSRDRIKVEQSVISNMEYFCGGKCAVIALSKKNIEESGLEPAEFDGLASIPLTVEGVKIGITAKERHDNFYKISVRTDDEIDASEFCREFGGGGHIRASGCEIKGTLQEVKQKLIAQAEKVLGE